MGTATEPTTSGLAEPKAPLARRSAPPGAGGGQNGGAVDGPLLSDQGVGQRRLQLGQEVASENEALTASFRASGSYAVVTEWKANVDVSTGAPVIKKEGVQHEKK